MEYVPGVPITDYCDHGLGPQGRSRREHIFATVGCTLGIRLIPIVL